MQIGRFKRGLHRLAAVAFVTAIAVAALALPGGAAQAQEVNSDIGSAVPGESRPSRYTAEVERWRELVQRYFRPEDVDKALYVIQYESDGNPEAVNRRSGAEGLFQIMPLHSVNGLDPETAVRWAAHRVYDTRKGWQDWGEGALYRGSAFGALGLRPYIPPPPVTSAPAADQAAAGKESTQFRELAAIVESTQFRELATVEEPTDMDDTEREGLGRDRWARLLGSAALNRAIHP